MQINLKLEEGLIYLAAIGVAGFFSIFLGYWFLIVALSVIWLFYAYKYLDYALYIVAFAAPLSFALNPMVGVDLELIRALTAVVIFVWFIKKIIKKEKINLNWAGWIIIALLAWMLLSILWSDVPSFALRKSIYFISIIPIYFVVCDVIASRDRLKQILKIILVSGFITSLIGIVQFVMQFIVGKKILVSFYQWVGRYLWGNGLGAMVINNPSWQVNINGRYFFRAIGPFPDAHNFSFYLVILFFVVFLGYWLGVSRKISLLAGGVTLTALLLSMARSGYVGLVFGLILIIVLLWRLINIKRNKLIIFAMALIAVVLLIPGQYISSRFYSIFDIQQGSNAERLMIWKNSLNIAKEHPLIGVGIGNYSNAVSADLPYRTSVNAHSNYLDFLTELGVVGLLLWLLIYGIIFYNLALARTNNNAFVVVGLTTIIGSFLVQSVFETGVYFPTVLVLIFIILGIASNIKQYD